MKMTKLMLGVCGLALVGFLQTGCSSKESTDTTVSADVPATETTASASVNTEVRNDEANLGASSSGRAR